MNYVNYNPYYESVQVLLDSKDKHYTESTKIQLILEDANSPVTRKYREKMYNFIINKAHIDFGDIPKSAGNIKNYSGYNEMVESLRVIKALAMDEKATPVLNYVEIVQDAINSIAGLSNTYEKGFTTKTDYVALEYDTYVYLCVEATTALIYSFVEYMKSPDTQLMEMKIKNTKLRADEFYFDQLRKFNAAQNKLGIEYRKMLESMCDKGKDNFIGTATAVGIGTVMVAAMAIVPITREVIYQIYNLRGKVSDYLEVQSNFLEMNKTSVENNASLTADKKGEILKKQEKLAKKLQKLSDAIRVKNAKSIMDSKRELQKDNKMLSIDNIKNEISNSPFEIM